MAEPEALHKDAMSPPGTRSLADLIKVVVILVLGLGLTAVFNEFIIHACEGAWKEFEVPLSPITESLYSAWWIGVAILLNSIPLFTYCVCSMFFILYTGLALSLPFYKMFEVIGN